MPLVDRDLIVQALVTKAVTTHASVKMLAQEGLGASASVLSRVLLENVILLEWLLRGEGSFRLDLYALSAQLLMKRLDEIIDEHYAHDPSLVARARQRIAKYGKSVKAIFGDTHWRWARTLGPDGRTLLPTNVSIENMLRKSHSQRTLRQTRPSERALLATSRPPGKLVCAFVGAEPERNFQHCRA